LGVNRPSEETTVSHVTPPGWYADPHGHSAYRWWDGQTWSAHTHGGHHTAPAAGAAGYAGDAAFGSAAFAPARPGYFGGVASAMPQQQQAAPYRQASQSGWRSNEYAFYTFAIVALYAIIALKAHVYVLGILPVMMSFRSKARNEALAIPAIIAAGIAIVVAVMGFTGH
jgi:hypothetical protein